MGAWPDLARGAGVAARDRGGARASQALRRQAAWAGGGINACTAARGGRDGASTLATPATAGEATFARVVTSVERRGTQQAARSSAASSNVRCGRGAPGRAPYLLPPSGLVAWPSTSRRPRRPASHARRRTQLTPAPSAAAHHRGVGGAGVGTPAQARPTPHRLVSAPDTTRGPVSYDLRASERRSFWRDVAGDETNRARQGAAGHQPQRDVVAVRTSCCQRHVARGSRASRALAGAVRLVTRDVAASARQPAGGVGGAGGSGSSRTPGARCTSARSSNTSGSIASLPAWRSTPVISALLAV